MELAKLVQDFPVFRQQALIDGAWIDVDSGKAITLILVPLTAIRLY